MPQLKILILKFLSVDGLATSAPAKHTFCTSCQALIWLQGSLIFVPLLNEGCCRL